MSIEEEYRSYWEQLPSCIMGTQGFTLIAPRQKRLLSPSPSTAAAVYHGARELVAETKSAIAEARWTDWLSSGLRSKRYFTGRRNSKRVFATSTMENGYSMNIESDIGFSAALY